MRKLNCFKGRKGFTLVELSLSIVFISVLSITVVIMISNAVSAYHKGLTFNQLNTAGMAIVDDMRTTIQGSPATAVVNDCADEYVGDELTYCEKDKGQSFINKEGKEKVTYSDGKSVTGEAGQGVPIYGVFCTGAYSYLWNSGYLRNSDYKINNSDDMEGLSLTYSFGGKTEKISDFNLLKIQDDKRMVCKKAATDGDKSNNNKDDRGYLASGDSGMTREIDISEAAIDQEPIDLLDGNASLRVYDLTAESARSDNIDSIFYAISLTLGTTRGGVDVIGNSCAEPENLDLPEDFDYCAINNFNFSAMANGG